MGKYSWSQVETQQTGKERYGGKKESQRKLVLRGQLCSFFMGGLVKSVQDPTELDELSEDEDTLNRIIFNFLQTKPKFLKYFV